MLRKGIVVLEKQFFTISRSVQQGKANSGLAVTGKRQAVKKQVFDKNHLHTEARKSTN